MKKLSYIISLLSILCSCHDDQNEPETNMDRRTLIVYMAAENNLASFADDDIDEMKTASMSLDNDQNLIVYVDRASSKSEPYLARIYKGELVDTLFMPEALAADPNTLMRAIQKAKVLYPAKSYGLLLWGHASGWLISDNDSISVAQSRAYGGSTGNNSSLGSGKYWMNIPQMSKAIATAMGSDKLEFIFGDCCSFACMEIAYELRHITDYVIGSPAEIPDMGAPYNTIIPDMFRENDNYYRQVIDNYYNYYLEVYQTQQNRYYNSKPGDLAGYSVPLATIKTDQLENLATATSSILGTISDKISTSGELDLDHIIFYAYYGNFRYAYDMSGFLKANASASDYAKWLTVLQQAVPYSRYSAKWMSNYSQLISCMNDFVSTENDYSCVSMFFPSKAYSNTSPNWNNAIRQYQWNDVIHWEQYGW